MTTFAAIDLGATSGRVITWDLAARRLTEVHRFPNRPVQVVGTLYWDMLALYGELLEGLRAAGPELASIGIDSWAVDYGLLDADGVLLGNPVHYRDARTTGVMEHVRSVVPDDELYDRCGLQFLPFNTVYQLLAEQIPLERAETLLMVPDLLAYWLTGRKGAELTNASTTGLFDVRTRGWSASLMERLGIPSRLFPPLREPGEVIGPLLPEIGLGEVPVTTVASHDTASAIAAVPALDDDFAYISCGTWSLVGVELPGPVLTEEGRTANFTNEAGIDGTVRYLRNVMGLWLLSESLRTWDSPPLAALLEEAAKVPAFRSLVNPDAPEFLAPGDIPARITAYCRTTGQPVPSSRAETVRCVLDSLALGHRAAVRQAAELSGREVRVVHLVGGGSLNELLCQATADACGLPVVAGPAEATALGNVLLQARAFGLVKDRTEMRALVAETQRLRRYEPRGDEQAWSAAAHRVGL